MIRFEIQDANSDVVPMFLRPMLGSDINYVRSSWFKNYQPLAKVSPSTFSKYHPRLIDEILASKQASTVIACTDSDPNVVHGWACGEIDGPLHFAYVPPNMRGRGVARAMISAVLGQYPNHINVTHRFVGRPDSRRFSYNPYILRINA